MDSSNKNSNIDNKIIATQMSFSGPIPPPHILVKYEELQPGFAERIVRMAEIQSDHRRELESKKLEAQIRRTNDSSS